MFNCMLIDLKGMLIQGFKMGNVEIELLKLILMVIVVIVQIIVQVVSYIYGGIIINCIDEVLVLFVIVSYNKYCKIVEEWSILDVEGYVNFCIIKECYDVFQLLEYEVNILYIVNG